MSRGLSGVLTKPRLDARSIRISFAVERSAPAPASVTGAKPPLCPTARRVFISGIRVIRVSLRPKRSQTRERFVAHRVQRQYMVQHPTPTPEYSYWERMS
jgi:hypothetical protein